MNIPDTEKALVRKLRTNIRFNHVIQGCIENYKALYREGQQPEYVKGLSSVLFGFGASSVKDLAGASLPDAAYYLACDLLGRK